MGSARIIKNKDYSISFVRMVATLCIVACHIMQHFGVELAWWFNVGVQMFLFISGFLYANRKITDPIKFYKKTFSKILLDYYIYIGLFIIGYSVATQRIMDFGSMLGLLTFSSMMPNIKHLWFIPYILFCYFLVPIMLRFFDNIEKKNNIKHFLWSIVILWAVHMTVQTFVGYFIPAYIVCFVMGIMFRRVKKRHKEAFVVNGLIIIVAIIMNLVQILTDVELPGTFKAYSHVFLGICLVMALREVFLLGKKIVQNKTVRLIIKAILDWFDKYSYDIYIVHSLYIIGDVSMYALMGGFWRPTIMIIVLIIISALILHLLADFIKKLRLYLLKKSSVL